MEFFPTCFNQECPKHTGCTFKKGYEYLNNSCYNTIWKGDKPCPDRIITKSSTQQAGEMR